MEQFKKISAVQEELRNEISAIRSNHTEFEEKTTDVVEFGF
jgi:hypothetical protein